MNELIASLLGDYAPMLPELIVAVGAMILLMVGVFQRPGEGVGLVCWLAVLVLVVAGTAVTLQPETAASLFRGAFVVDPFARFMKLLAIAGSALVLILSFDYLKKAKILQFEFPVLVLLATTGMLLMISANDLISLYLGLELQSLALYVLAAIRRDDVKSSEAGLKYFVLGALSSGMLLYGASILYGFTGSTQFDKIAGAIVAGTAGQIGMIFGLVFLLAGLAFKISAVPFHMWTPDVYEGAPTPVTAFFASAPKIAAMALLVRAMLGAFPGIDGQWQQIVIFLSIASMLLGAFAAIGQTNIKRLMAYSSIANMGYALVGLAAGSLGGTSAVLFYLAIYLAMTIGTFGCILAMQRKGEMVEEISQLSGLSRTNLPLAIVLALLMFSLAGIPPLAGFLAKLQIFNAAIAANLYGLAIVGVLASVVGAYYYLRIVKIMFFDEAAEPFSPVPAAIKLIVGLAGAFIVLYVFYPAPLLAAAERAARTFF